MGPLIQQDCGMPKNQVQFQKGFSLSQFQARFASEAKCWEALFKIKFPDGFCCPRCNHRRFYRVQHRQGMVCASCRKHVSSRANTLMQHHAVPRVSCARYLDAFAWRFNHRYDLKGAFDAGLSAIMCGAPSTKKNLQVNHCR